MKLMLMAASLRKDSLNKKLIQLTAELLHAKKENIDLAEFAEFDMPLYHGDVNAVQGLPQGALKFVYRMQQANGLIISSPEYNFSTPGPLKNLIDWVSRGQPMPWMGQKILLLSASPSLVGGNRGLWQTRIPLECCGAFVYPDMFSLAAAHTTFTEDGQLHDGESQKRLVDLLEKFCSFAS